jgi:hypothetical protein
MRCVYCENVQQVKGKNHKCYVCSIVRVDKRSKLYK